MLPNVYEEVAILIDKQTGIFDLDDIAKTGSIACFHLEKDVNYLPLNKKNKKIKSVLREIEENHNHSWYKEMQDRAEIYSKMPALFYRGNKICFGSMMESADILAAALDRIGIKAESEVAVCMSNVPELAYIMLSLNKLGAKMNSFSASYNPDYICDILADCDPAVMFVTDDSLDMIYDHIAGSRVKKVVVISRKRSLPVNPEKCDEYVPELSEFYQISDRSEGYIDGDRIISYDIFVKENTSDNSIEDRGTLDSEFLVSYTSGSTKIGFPKAIIHTNRSLIVSGRFHDAEVSGNPDLKGLRALAMIHSDSNTCLITCISDILMQGWCVAFEPEYNVKDALNYLILNKPNYANMTSSFWNEAARQYLIEKRFSDRKLGFLLAAFAVGENIGNGEEYFLNTFLKRSKAGSSVSIKGFHLPYVTISIGGGDCEHGGIYYTLWKTTHSKLNYLKLKGKSIGMLPEKYVLVTALKEVNGKWIHCEDYQLGVIVANSATTMKCYKNNPIETKNKIITDENGRDWVSCNVLGYIDKKGAVHVKGRIEEFKRIGSEIVYPFAVDDVIDQDRKNILSSTTVFKKDGGIVANVILNPLSKENENTVVERAKKRCNKKLTEEVMSILEIKVFKHITDFPLTGSGKRNIRALEEL